MKGRIPNHPPWVLWVRYGAMAGWLIIFLVGSATTPSGQRRSPFMEHGLTMLLLGLCVGGVGASFFFGRFGQNDEPEAMSVFVNKVGGLWFMVGGLLIGFMGISRL